MDKQIFAALEIADGEIRLVIGEFFNTRFNVIKVERVLTSGIEGINIVDSKDVMIAIKKAVNNASKLIGAKIQRVLLAIPSLDMVRKPLKITVPIPGAVSKSDINKALKKAMETEISEDLALINAVCVKYTCNGISTRRMPINEFCNSLTVDIDLLCANKELAFSYVSLVERSGLEIIDICLDLFAISKEAALFEQTVDHNLIILKMERQVTTLGLLSKGKLISSEVLNVGLHNLIGKLADETQLPIPICSRLIKYNCRFNSDKHLDSPSYIWANNGQTKTLSEQEIYTIVAKEAEYLVEEIYKAAEPTLKDDKISVIITGEGAELQGFKQLIRKKLDVNVKNYIPETLGVRNGSLSTVLGLFYNYKDQLAILNNSAVSIDLLQFNQTIQIKKDKQEDNSFTGRLKGILFDNKKKEEH